MFQGYYSSNMPQHIHSLTHTQTHTQNGILLLGILIHTINKSKKTQNKKLSACIDKC